MSRFSLGNPSPETAARAPGGGRGFCALENKLVVMTGRDAISYNYRQWQKSSDAGVRVEAFGGHQFLSHETYLRVAETFQPDLLVTLTDEVPAETPEHRQMTSAARTLKWLDAALKSAADSRMAPILAPLQGGTSLRARRHSAAESAKRDRIFGFALCGFGTGETAQQRRECIAAALDEVQSQQFKLIQGALTPDGILEAVSLGVDCFDGTYATQTTAAGYALDFEDGPTTQTREFVQDDTKLNLLHPRFRESTEPLVQTCCCFTCQNHTRAYLHHLMLAHEMTAQILLEMHNLHQLLLFFRQIRQAIRDSRFEEFQEHFFAKRLAFREGKKSA